MGGGAMIKTERSIECWEKAGDEKLISTAILPFIPLAELKKAFFIDDANDPMYEVFVITDKQAEFLKKWIDIDFNFGQYDYHLNCYKIE
jgi:hypothetical protein